MSKRKPAAPLVIQIWQTAGHPRESEGKFSAKWAKSKGSSKTDSQDDLKNDRRNLPAESPVRPPRAFWNFSYKLRGGGSLDRRRDRNIGLLNPPVSRSRSRNEAVSPIVRGQTHSDFAPANESRRLFLKNPAKTKVSLPRYHCSRTT